MVLPCESKLKRCAGVVLRELFLPLTVLLDGDHPTCAVHLHLLWQGMLIIANYHLAEGAYPVRRLGLREEDSRWDLVMQGVQEDYRRWCLDCVDNGCCHRPQVRQRVSFSRVY